MLSSEGKSTGIEVVSKQVLSATPPESVSGLDRDQIFRRIENILSLLQERLLLNQDANSRSLEAFTTLNQLLDNLDHQIRILVEAAEQPKNSKEKLCQ